MKHAVGLLNGNWRAGDYAQFITRSTFTERELALDEIKKIMGSVNFNTWYDRVYLLRKAEKQVEYEHSIFGKLETLRGLISNINSAQNWVNSAKTDFSLRWANSNLAYFKEKLENEIKS